jgi:hypothetical protein
MIVCACLVANNHFLLAQEAASSTSQPIPPPRPLLADSVGPVYYYLVGDPRQRILADDTLPDLAFRMYDPARRQGAFDYGHLGNFGSSARPLEFGTRSRVGFETGMRAFDLYQLAPTDLRFYKHTRTYSHAGFTRGRTQRDAASSLLLSRTFEKGLCFSLNYRTFNNLGEYRFQRVKHSALAAGIWWPVSKNYDLFLIYASNTNQQEDNGGITDTDFFADPDFFDGPISVPTRFESEAKTKHKRNNLQLSQTATVGKSRNQLKLAHQLNYRTESWKFSDKNAPKEGQTTNEEIFYAPYLKDPRGVRHYFDLWRLDNHVTLSTVRKNKKGAEAAIVSAGLRHSLIGLYREPLADSSINNLFATGSIAFRPIERMALVVQGDLGIIPTNAGEYRLDATMDLPLGKFGQLKGRFLSQRHPADLIHARLVSTGVPVWSNGFNRINENSLYAGYTLPKLGFSAFFNNHLVGNYLYFDQMGLPVQTGDVVPVSQIGAHQRLNWWKLRTEHSFAVQQTSSDVVRLPKWYAKSSVAIEGRLFKKALLMNVGVDFRINSAFRPDAYQPFIGQFQLQDTFEQKPYPWIDVFFGAKIQSFRLYFRFENMAPIWASADNLYLTANHPQNRQTIRLGISWRFLDRNQAVPGEQDSGGGGPAGPPSGIGGGRRF